MRGKQSLSILLIVPWNTKLNASVEIASLYLNRKLEALAFVDADETSPSQSCPTCG